MNTSKHIMREDALKGFRFTPGTVRSEIFREGARPYNPSYGGQVDNLKKEVKEESKQDAVNNQIE